MNVLITGITGFAGSHLAEFLLSKGYEVHGIKRWRSRTENIEGFKDKIQVHECDIKDYQSVKKVIDKVKPGKIFHLAAQSFVPTSWNAPTETITTNVLGELNIFEAVREAGITPWIQIACSSEEYGLVHESETPMKETNPLRPLSPYAVSKIAQDFLGYQYTQSYKLNVVRTRTFNHEGPRRGEVFVTSNFAKQIAEIEKSKKPPVIYVGNLEARRDYTDVRDIVRGYWLATEKCIAGEVYNICSGRDWKIKDMLNYLLSLSKVKVEIKQDPARMRPSDVELLLGDNTKFVKQTGWKPEIKFEKTLEDTLNYWRERV
ncbi:MAG: GDP-mannose 4,6-dehydratase [Elusimicrobia bacterium RIFOXYD2_FULL_34_15]|nr:MAG: GDP-mannose 4,6-dehydratase [Elusimicrobia bacterium RIFOXYD2_FULL_34_15]